MLPVGLDNIRSLFNLDPTDLSALLSAHFGTVSQKILDESPSQLHVLLPCKQESFLSYMEERFGMCPSLDAALLCLMTKAHDAVNSCIDGRNQVSILNKYSKAIDMVQEAVYDPDAWANADVLGAVQLLALFEVSVYLFRTVPYASY